MTLSLIGVATYILVLRGLATHWIGVKLAAIIAVGFPFLVNLAISAIYVFGLELSMANLLPLAAIVTAMLQLIVCLLAFSMMQRHDENIAAWLSIAILGLIVNYALIPQLLPRLL